jgi:hypothetical protein
MKTLAIASCSGQHPSQADGYIQNYAVKSPQQVSWVTIVGKKLD